jgi:hypothetical protein
MDRLDRLCCKIGRVRIDGPDSNSAGMDGHVRPILDFGSNDVDGSTDRLEACCVCAMDFFLLVLFDWADFFWVTDQITVLGSDRRRKNFERISLEFQDYCEQSRRPE